VAGFDAERYLRLAGKRWLRESGSIRPPWNPVLAATGAALVTVGAMTTARARAVIEDYEQALVSDEDQQRPRMSEQAARPVAPAASGIGQLRVVPSGQVIDRSWGQLTIVYVAFTDRATTVRVIVQPSQPPEHPYGPPVPAAVKKLAVTDDRGTSGSAEFFGELRRGDPTWRGDYEVHRPLASDTAWIELLGQRVELTGEPAGIQAWIEPLPAQDPARRHLWERVATLNDFHDLRLALETTIATLIAAGALREGDPEIGNARAVLATLRPAARPPLTSPLAWRSRGDRCWPAGTRPEGRPAPSRSAPSPRRSTA
jgi:hypothetical protein